VCCAGRVQERKQLRAIQKQVRDGFAAGRRGRRNGLDRRLAGAALDEDDSGDEDEEDRLERLAREENERDEEYNSQVSDGA
jgi:hypothetical protein